jgi:hypothetical protein
MKAKFPGHRAVGIFLLPRDIVTVSYVHAKYDIVQFLTYCINNQLVIVKS